MKNYLFKRVLSLTASVTMVFTMADFSVLNHRYFANAADIPLTDSDNDGVYEIGTAQDLQTFSSLVSKGYPYRNLNIKLTADIVINDKALTVDESGNPFYDGKAINDKNKPIEWQPIGNSTQWYDGTFDGGGHTVSGIYIDSSDNYQGLFGRSIGTIKNISVIDSYVKGSWYIGGVCGKSYNGGIITNCYNKGSVSGINLVGGVCGDNYNNSIITNCYNTGFISGIDHVGGVCGECSDACTIMSCYNTGSVSGTDEVGGICGFNYGTITNCYDKGFVDGEDKVGGVCGWNFSKITNCYYLKGTAKGGVERVDTDGAKAMTDAQFKSGEVAFLLNNSLSVGAISFYQKIGTDNTPVLNSTNGTVYYGYKDCSSTVKSYSNTALSDTIVPHTYVNGVCTVCGKSEKEPTVALGDIDNNGTINAADASMALTEYAAVSTGQTSSLSDDARTAADVNKDKIINAGDASLILTYYAKLSLTGSASFDNL